MLVFHVVSVVGPGAVVGERVTLPQVGQKFMEKTKPSSMMKSCRRFSHVASQSTSTNAGDIQSKGVVSRTAQRTRHRCRTPLIGVFKGVHCLNAEDLDERPDGIHVVVVDQPLQGLRLAEVLVLLQQFGRLTSAVGVVIQFVTACLQDRSVEVGKSRATSVGHVTAGEAQVSLGHALSGADGEFSEKCLSFEHGIV